MVLQPRLAVMGAAVLAAVLILGLSVVMPLAATPQMEAALDGSGKASGVKDKASKKSAGKSVEERESSRKAKARAANVYSGQPAVTEKELLAFVELLPGFRAWAKEGHEEAHPVVRNGKADFSYSPRAADWVKAQGWQPERFFCVMGRLAAALVIVEEGNDMRGTRPADMPSVSNEELALARRHMGVLLSAGGTAPPIRP